MRLPGRLRDTTLGDLLGTLHRERMTGCLELVELSGSGRVHRIRLEDGQVVAVDGAAQSPKLGELLALDVQARRGGQEGTHKRIGEYLLSAGFVTHAELRAALHRQLASRLDSLYQLSDARILFRAPRPLSDDPTAPLPLQKSEFLVGRPRRRARQVRTTPASERDLALAALGLSGDVTRIEVQRAFRRLAQSAHPDRYPSASPVERQSLLQRFASLSHAYHLLTG